jgi:serine/threonine protein phosphatase PrpC
MAAQIGAAWRPAVGQQVCGDAYTVAPFAEGTLICLADGLGHGPEAREAAQVACAYARAHADEPLEPMLRGMSAALASTRGAAVSVMSLLPASRRALFAGVGNVDLRAISRERIAPPTTPGILGQRTRSVRVWEYSLAEGDLLVLFSDGISSRFDLGELAHLEPQALADALLAKQHKTHDDACCVVTKLAPASAGA